MTHKISPDRIAFPRTMLAYNGTDFYAVKCDSSGNLSVIGMAALLTELKLKADLTETQPVSVVSLPLPSGAATSSVQLGIALAMAKQAGTWGLYNITMADADTEYSRALPSNTKKFLIKCRGSYDLKVCFTATESGTEYLTVPAGMSYWEDLIQPVTFTLYFQCATAAQVVEIVAWS